jgi:hypothetical protein
VSEVRSPTDPCNTVRQCSQSEFDEILTHRGEHIHENTSVDGDSTMTCIGGHKGGWCQRRAKSSQPIANHRMVRIGSTQEIFCSSGMSGVLCRSRHSICFRGVPLADLRPDGIRAEQAGDTIKGPCWLSSTLPGDFIQPADGTVIWPRQLDLEWGRQHVSYDGQSKLLIWRELNRCSTL